MDTPLRKNAVKMKRDYGGVFLEEEVVNSAVCSFFKRQQGQVKLTWGQHQAQSALL